MKTSKVSVQCKCGYEHTGFEHIKFVRDRINQPKAYCTKCNRRVFICRYTFQSGPEKKVLVR